MASVLSTFGVNLPPVSRSSVVVTVAAVTTVTVFLAVKLFHKRRETTKNAATVTKLVIYPIKSIEGIIVDHLKIAPNGASYNDFHDRGMILLNKENRMITQRQNGALAKVRSSLIGKSQISLKAESMEELIIDVKKIPTGSSSDLIHFSIWGSATTGVEVSREASNWFSRFLNEAGVRLVIFTSKCKPRPTHVSDANGGKWDVDRPIQYQDGSPVHLTNEATLDALNSSAQSSGRNFKMQAFRPNIVVRSPVPLEELSWYSCVIDSITFLNVRLCTRCVIPTSDPWTGERDAEKTPIMQAHRSAVDDYERKNYQQQAIFGINLVPNRKGVITVGSTVDITR